MELVELIAGLDAMTYHVDPAICVSCERRCDFPQNGCTIINRAVDALRNLQSALDKIQTLYSESKGTTHSTLLDVLRIFDLENKPAPEIMRHVYDMCICENSVSLYNEIKCIDDIGGSIVAVTQNSRGMYTVIFRRPII